MSSETGKKAYAAPADPQVVGYVGNAANDLGLTYGDDGAGGYAS